MSQNPEDEWFARLDAEKRRRIAVASADQDAVARAAELKALHHMHCGKCGQPMLTRRFKTVEIEQCPSCGAVLLDPGELELLAGADQAGAIDTIAAVFGFRKKA